MQDWLIGIWLDWWIGCSQDCSINAFVIHAFIHWLSRWSFCSESSRHCQSQTVRAGELHFWQNVYPLPCVICNVPHVTCHKFFPPFFLGGGGGSSNNNIWYTCIRKRCHLLDVRCHMSLFCVSTVTCHMSLRPTATATSPTPANSPTMHST